MKQLQTNTLKPHSHPRLVVPMAVPTWDDDVRKERRSLGYGAYQIRRLPTLDEQEFELTELD